MRGTNKGSSSKLDYARVAIESHVVELHTHVSTRAKTVTNHVARHAIYSCASSIRLLYDDGTAWQMTVSLLTSTPRVKMMLELKAGMVKAPKYLMPSPVKIWAPALNQTGSYTIINNNY